MTKDKQVAILFSGGTDSTYVASMEQEKYHKVFLLSYYRDGISSIENSCKHVRKLEEKYTDKIFEHYIFNVSDIFKELSYENYLSNIKKHGLFLLSSCGFCKLAMHIKTLQFCIDNGIGYVCDGAHKNMNIYPFQRKELTDMLRTLYSDYGIHYYNPVFDLPSEKEMSMFEKFIQPMLTENKHNENEYKTIGCLLHETGIVNEENIKGTKYDKDNQAQCMQLFMLRFLALGYFIPTFGMKAYAKQTVLMFKDKITYAKKYIIDIRQGR